MLFFLAALQEDGTGGVASYVREGLECLAHLAKTQLTKGTIEMLWIRIKGQIINLDVIIGVHYRPPGQEMAMMNYSLRK